ncbi:MAG: hypothetical protein LBI95_03065 [Holosporales bacterium]|nr:hypothetical protein [Holosporales bacterium]
MVYCLFRMGRRGYVMSESSHLVQTLIGKGEEIAYIPKLVDGSLRGSYNDIYDIRYKIQTKSS